MLISEDVKTIYDCRLYGDIDVILISRISKSSRPNNGLQTGPFVENRHILMNIGGRNLQKSSWELC